LAGSKLNKRKANALSGADREKVEPIVKDLNAKWMISINGSRHWPANARLNGATIKEISMQ
jgi:hypothetical protein